MVWTESRISEFLILSNHWIKYEYVFVHLCDSAIIPSLDSNNTCTTDIYSLYYHYYGRTSYPSTICNLACGPFIHDRSHFQPFLDTLADYPVLNYLWQFLFDYTYIPWAFTIMLAVVISTTFNSIDVLKFSTYTNEISLESQILILETENKKQERLIKRLKVIEDRSVKVSGEAGEGDGNGDGQEEHQQQQQHDNERDDESVLKESDLEAVVH